MTERQMYLRIAYNDYSEQTANIRDTYSPEQADLAAAECAYYEIHGMLPAWAIAIGQVIVVGECAIFVTREETTQ